MRQAKSIFSGQVPFIPHLSTDRSFPLSGCKKHPRPSDDSDSSEFGVVSSTGAVVGSGRTCTRPLFGELAESPDMLIVLELRRIFGSSLVSENREELCENKIVFESTDVLKPIAKLGRGSLLETVVYGENLF